MTPSDLSRRTAAAMFYRRAASHAQHAALQREFALTDEDDRAELSEAYSRIELWLKAYAFGLCLAIAGDDEAAAEAAFRDPDVRSELRDAVLRIVRGVQS